MLVEVKVLSPGESITEVQIANWLVEDGDHVEKDDEIVEIDSDKATLSISSEAEGAIKIEVEEGETVEVGAVIAKIDTEAEGKKKEQTDEEQEPEEESSAEPATEKEKAQESKASEEKTQKATSGQTEDKKASGTESSKA